VKIKNLSNSKKVVVLSVGVLIFGAIFYSFCDLLGYDKKFKFYILIGMVIALVINIGSSIIKLKMDGALYDERDSHIEKQSNAVTFDIFQIILALIGLFTYNIKTINVSLGGYTFFLFFLMWIIRGLVSIFVKRKI
jgi:uncharacterized membrane protein